MAEDTQDQGTPSALRPRPGWDKSARNPEAVHGNLDTSAVASTGYMDPSYQPPKLSPHPHSDAGEFDQSLFKEAQQGHRLSRAASPNSVRGGGRGSGGGGAGLTGDEALAPELDGAPRADGRPAWDSRFVLERTPWEVQPRTTLLRPPSTNAFPGSGVRRSMPVNTGVRGGAGGGLSDGGGGFSPSGRRTPGYDTTDGTELGSRASGNVIGNTDGNGTRTTILPGLYAASPPIWASPYGEHQQPQAQQSTASGAGRQHNPTSPGTSPSALAGGASSSTAAATTPRAPRIDLTESYIGRAYSPDTSYTRGRPGSRGLGGGGGSVDGGGGPAAGGDAAAVPQGAPAAAAEGDGNGDGGVDGHGTHLPALERAYFGKKAGAGKDKDKDAAAEKAAAAAAKASAQQAAIQALGAVYMPGGKLRLVGGTEPRSARGRPGVAAPPPLYARGCRSNDGDGERQANSVTGGVGGGGGTDRGRERERDMSPGPGGGVWRPSGRQPIPESAPPVPRNTHRSTSGEETQEEADRRRAAPRDPAIYSPERYPLVGQGWFMPPEKFPPNPVYAGVKAKYLESRPPRVETDQPNDTLKALPDIHSKPWLTPGKHLVTDSSAPPPKVTGTAGARPNYAFSPSATGTSVATGTLRSNKGGNGGGGGTGRRGRSPVKGRKRRDSSSSRNRSSSRSRSRSGSRSGGEVEGEGGGGDAGEEEEEEEVAGDRQVLAVIGGVRLMSIVRRENMADEARLEAQEDAQMAAEEDSQKKQQRQQQHEREEEREEDGQDDEEASGSRRDDPGDAEGPAVGRRSAGQDQRRASGLSASGSARRKDEDDLGGKGGDGGRQKAEGGRSSPQRQVSGGSGGSGRRRSSSNSSSSSSSGRGREEQRQQQAEGGAEEEQDNGDGGDYGAGDDAGDGDDDDDVAAAAAMAGLGDGDGDVDADADAGDQEEAAEEAEGDDWE